MYLESTGLRLFSLFSWFDCLTVLERGGSENSDISTPGKMIVRSDEISGDIVSRWQLLRDQSSHEDAHLYDG